MAILGQAGLLAMRGLYTAQGPAPNSQLDWMPKPRCRALDGAKFTISCLSLNSDAARLIVRPRCCTNLDLASKLLGGFIGDNGEVLGLLAVQDFAKSLCRKATLEQLPYCGCPARHPPRKPPGINDPQLLRHQHDLEPLASIEIAHLTRPREAQLL